MAQRQFRSDDTSKWQERYGNGSDGALVISSDTTYGPTFFGCDGTATSTTLNCTTTGFTVGDLIIIYQAVTNGSGTTGNWELNKVAAIPSGLTLTYPLINTYTQAGAFVQKLPQYSSVTINSGKVYGVTQWNGTKGGLLAFLCTGTTSIVGTLTTESAGFRAGAGGDDTTSKPGEGYTGTHGTQGNSSDNGGRSANASAGGGGGNGGIGKVNGNGADESGSGSTAGNSSLTSVAFGGGGGGAGSNGHTYNGGNGGGFVLVISKIITVSGAIKAIGGVGTDAAPDRGGGGAAAGSILLKGQVVTLGSSLVQAVGGNGGIGNGSSNGGGAGAGGRVHVDYSGSVSGTASVAGGSGGNAGTSTTTQDSTLADFGGAAIMATLI